MSVVSCTPTRVGISGKAEGKDQGITRSYSVEFRVVTSAVTDQTVTILDYFRANGPWIGAKLNILGQVDNTVQVTSIEPKKNPNSQTEWRVAVSYEQPSTEDSKKDKNGKDSTNPLDWNDEISIDHTKIQEPVYRAKHRGGLPKADGEEVVPQNSAGVPFDPPLMRDVPIRVVRISRYKPEFLGAAATFWVGTVNSRLVIINRPNILYADLWPQYTARIEEIGGSFGIRNEVPHWKVTTTIHIHPRSWRQEVVDRGISMVAQPGIVDGMGRTTSMATVKNRPTIYRMRDRHGNIITEPVLLDGNGQPLPLNADPHWLTFQIDNEADFNGADLF